MCCPYPTVGEVLDHWLPLPCRVDHPVKGQAIYAYVTLTDAGRHDDAMRKRLADHVRQLIGPFAVPDTIHWVSVTSSVTYKCNISVTEDKGDRRKCDLVPDTIHWVSGMICNRR
jgi:hypothetical protein